MRRTLLVTAMALGLVLSMMAGAVANNGKAIQRASHDGSSMSAAAIYGWGGIYENDCTSNGVDAGFKGRANITNPVGNPYLLLRVSLTDMVPDSTYVIYRDNNGMTAAGPFTRLGELTTDSYGHGTFELDIDVAPMAPGSYTWGIVANGPANCGLLYTVVGTDGDLVFDIADSA